MVDNLPADVLATALADLVKRTVAEGAYGVVLRGFQHLPVLDLAGALGGPGKVYVSIIGPHDQTEALLSQARGEGWSEPGFGLDATHAVQVRNSNDLAPSAIRLVIVWRDEERLHSLTRRGYVVFGPQDALQMVCELASEHAPNDPQRNLWRALRNPQLASFVSLDSILDYFSGVMESRESNPLDTPRQLLPRLGLLPDSQLLTAKFTSEADLVRRLQANAEMVERLQQADEEDRARAIAAIEGSDADKAAQLRRAYTAFLRLARSDQAAIADLDLVDAERLLAGRPSKTPPPPRDKSTTADETAPNPGSTAGVQYRVFANLTDAAVRLTLEGDHDAVRSFVSQAAARLERDEQHERSLIEGRLVVPFAPDNRALALADTVVGVDRFGGTLATRQQPLGAILQDIGSHADGFRIFDSVRMRKLQQLLGNAKQLLPDFRGAELLDEYLARRERILPLNYLLTAAPLACLLAQTHVLSLVEAAIAAYQNLLAHLDEHYGQLQQVSPEGAYLIYREVLCLDLIAVAGADDQAVLLSPVNPLVLWKFVELANLISQWSQHPEATSQELLRLVEQVPEPLLTICLPGRNAHEAQEFGYSHHMASLPVYRPMSVEPADVNADSLRIAATKLAALYPAVKGELRVMLVNPRSTRPAARAVEKLTGTGGFQSVVLVIARTGDAHVDALQPHDEAFDRLVAEGKLSVEEVRASTLEGLIEPLRKRPVHLLGLAGERMKSVELVNRERTRLNPISLPRRLYADPLLEKITLKPRSLQPELGGPQHPFGAYQSVVSQLLGKAQSEYSLRETSPVSLHRWRDLLPFCQFCVVAGDLPEQAPDATILRLTQSAELAGDTVFTVHMSRITKGIDGLLRKLNYQPTQDGLKKVVSQLQVLGGEGIFSTISDKGAHGFVETALRGQLGLAVALKWYRSTYPDDRNLTLSLDSYLARQWLHNRPDDKRTDLLGIKQDATGAIAIDIIEVKSYQATDEENIETTHPAQQLGSIGRVMYDILHRQGNMLIDCRRELLRLLVFREGLLMQSGWDPAWVTTLNRVLDGNANDRVSINLILVELAFEQNIPYSDEQLPGSDSPVDPVDALPIRRVRLGEQDIDKHLRGLVERSRVTNGGAQAEGRTDGSGGDVNERSVSTDESQVVPDSKATAESNGDLGAVVIQEVATSQLESGVHAGTEPSAEERAQIAATAQGIYRVLHDVGIKVAGGIDPALAEVGPSVIRFKVRLQPGERVGTLESRARDLMRELALEKEPIIGNLPGTIYVSIDLPRSVRRVVSLRQFLERVHHPERDIGLYCPIGVTPSGGVEWLDITALPHMLVAGSTGSGKTMFLYSLIIGLTHLYSPAEVQLVLVDPKQTDFVFFEQLPHLRGGAIITDPHEAIATLMNLLTNELQERTDTLKAQRCRDIRSYNARQTGQSLAPIVVVIDEFADLAEVMDRGARDNFDRALRRLAQRARNVGIHLVIATQRPTTDIVNGTLKTNLLCRVSFRLASQIDSRTILDVSGAEHLLGNGDMLVKWNGNITRLQGFYVSEQDMIAMLGLETI